MKIILKKINAQYGKTVVYELKDNENTINFNNLLGQKISIDFLNEFYCTKCGIKTKKLYGQGFCYHCFITAPEADSCIFHPEQCQAHEGISRDMEWSQQYCLKPHYVYLAKTSKIKVGVTMQRNIPYRWIDQGADQAVKLAKTPYRQLAGIIEVELKKHFSDKTNWRDMIKNISCDDDLIDAKQQAIRQLPADLQKFVVNDNTITKINYPMIDVPQKVESVKLDRDLSITGTLTGIKGQYLIIDNRKVINIRSHSGYLVEIEI